MSAAIGCPPFEEAISRFQAFLLENGWPTEIVWVKSGERLDPFQSGGARREYEFARHRGLGVCLDAIQHVGGSTFALVLSPRDADEAERLMYPSDGGLKLSLAVTSDAD